jgi:hypothetical protein
MSDMVELAKEAADRLTELREFRTTEPVLALVRYLDILIKEYQAEFEGVSPDGLVKLQARLRQVRALRDAVMSESPITAKVN